MKFLVSRDFDAITSALNFTTPDCRVTGGCDLYATKAAGSDKKFYKNIDKSLESQHGSLAAQHAALLKMGASLSPPQREQMAASLNLSRSSPFGDLSDIKCRRTFAYLIATLNASHSDYDFSHVLRPTDFRKEKNIRRVIASIDGTLNNVRPHASSHLSPSMGSYHAYSSSPSATATTANGGPAIGSPAWGPQMWAMVDKEMKLRDCTCFSYQPADDPFDGEEAAIWRLHYFFFNQGLKRVAYLYVRGVPVVVNSPALGPIRRGSSSLSKRHAPYALSSSASKRAKYWLGDRYAADTIIANEYDEDEFDDDHCNAVFWNPDEDVDIDPLNAVSSPEVSDDEYILSDDDKDEETEDGDSIAQSPIRGVSEDIAARMEIEV